MKEVPITADNANEQLKQLYQTAFPENEQIPWSDLIRLIGQMSLDFTAYYKEDEQMEQRKQDQVFGDSVELQRKEVENQLIGFTIVYPRQSFNWYWYFAVREDLRGKGYGQQILPQLIEKYKGQSCILDMESPYQVPCPNIEQRKRRHRFYLRNGFRDTNVYRSYGDITMTVMMMGKGIFTLQDWDDITNELKKYWWLD